MLVSFRFLRNSLTTFINDKSIKVMDEIKIPSKWQQVEINDSPLLLGIYVDLKKLAYQAFMLDLFQYKVWWDSVDKEQLESRLNAKGFEDLTPENMQYLLEVLTTTIESKDITFKNKDAMFLGLVNDKSVDWEFEFTPHDGKEILCKFSLQQMSTMSYLSFKYDKLVQLVSHKDHYIKYLTENYKSINGDELIKRYYKNNKNLNHELLNKFDETLWTEDINKDFDYDSDRNNLISATKVVTRPPRTSTVDNETEAEHELEAYDFSYSPKKRKLTTMNTKSLPKVKLEPYKSSHR